VDRQRLLRTALRAVAEVSRRRRGPGVRTPRRPRPPGRAAQGPVIGGYEPAADGEASPGEVVWAWVPFEEDASQGKDRPVLVIGRDGAQLLALQLTSQDHDRDAEQERRAGRLWMDIGSGGWDRSGHPSEVRTNRLLRLDPAGVRREGAALDRATYDAVVAAARQQLRLSR
jgi:hypothetical protein